MRLYVCVCVCRSLDNFQESVLSYHVGPGHGIRVVRLEFTLCLAEGVCVDFRLHLCLWYVGECVGMVG